MPVARPCPFPIVIRMSKVHHMPGHLIRRLQQISVSVFAERMKSAGVDLTAPQFAALALLRDHPGIDQATLAGLIAYDRPTMGGVVDRLAAKNLVARVANPEDGRAKVLSLTDKGNATLDRLFPLVENLQADILPGLNDAERADFIRLAARVAEAGNDLSRAPQRVPKGT
jgi:DNA-binding MarR family transcriptional regulator